MKVVNMLHACLWQTSYVQRHFYAAIGLPKRSGTAHARVILFGKLELFCAIALLGCCANTESSNHQQRGHQNHSTKPFYSAHDSFLPLALTTAHYTGFLLATPAIYRGGTEHPCSKFRA